MTHHLCRIGSIDARLVSDHHLEGELVQATLAANESAAAHATDRLHERISAAALVGVQQYFAVPYLHHWSPTPRPEVELADLLDQICSQPRALAIGRKAVGGEVEVRRPGAELSPSEIGEVVETGSPLVTLAPGLIESLADANGSIEIRQFDRQCPAWAGFADDMTTVAQAEVYMKLFIAGGATSVNGWHFDQSDVIVTMLHGAKRFAVKERAEQGTPTVDEVVRPGDAMHLPRAMDHCATPVSQISALLSVGLMRFADWSFRGVVPEHLGLDAVPTRATTYLASLRSHRARGSSIRHVVRSRCPGGVFLSSVDRGVLTFAAAGGLFEADETLYRVLLGIHEYGGATIDHVASCLGMSADHLGVACDKLIAVGLVC